VISSVGCAEGRADGGFVCPLIEGAGVGAGTGLRVGEKVVDWAVGRLVGI